MAEILAARSTPRTVIGMTLQPGTDLNLTIADPPSEPAFEDYTHDLARRNGYNHDRHVLIAPTDTASSLFTSIRGLSSKGSIA